MSRRRPGSRRCRAPRRRRAPAVVDRERRDLRDLAAGLGVVRDAFARVCPRLAQIRAPPHGRAVPFARRGRVDRTALRVVDRVVHRPALAERAAQRPVSRSLLSRKKHPLRVPISNNVRGIELVPPGRNPMGYLSDRRRGKKSSVERVKHGPTGARSTIGDRRPARRQSRWPGLGGGRDVENLAASGRADRRSEAASGCQELPPQERNRVRRRGRHARPRLDPQRIAAADPSQVIMVARSATGLARRERERRDSNPRPPA